MNFGQDAARIRSQAGAKGSGHFPFVAQERSASQSERPRLSSMTTSPSSYALCTGSAAPAAATKEARSPIEPTLVRSFTLPASIRTMRR
jgi:hypothetical protein